MEPLHSKEFEANQSKTWFVSDLKKTGASDNCLNQTGKQKKTLVWQTSISGQGTAADLCQCHRHWRAIATFARASTARLSKRVPVKLLSWISTVRMIALRLSTTSIWWRQKWWIHKVADLPCWSKKMWKCAHKISWFSWRCSSKVVPKTLPLLVDWNWSSLSSTRGKMPVVQTSNV